MLSIRRSLLALILAATAMLAACNTEPTEPPSDGGNGGGDYGALQTATYGDTLFTVGYFDIINTLSMEMKSLDTARYEGNTYVKQDTFGYTVTGGSFTSKRGDSTVGHWASSVQVGIGSKKVESGEYPIYGHDAHPSTPKSGLQGKARLFVYNLPGGLSYSHPDSSSGKVKVTVTADSIQVQSKDVKMSNGLKLTFNFKAKRAF